MPALAGLLLAAPVAADDGPRGSDRRPAWSQQQSYRDFQRDRHRDHRRDPGRDTRPRRDFEQRRDYDRYRDDALSAPDQRRYSRDPYGRDRYDRHPHGIGDRRYDERHHGHRRPGDRDGYGIRGYHGQDRDRGRRHAPFPGQAYDRHGEPRFDYPSLRRAPSVPQPLRRDRR